MLVKRLFRKQEIISSILIPGSKFRRPQTNKAGEFLP